MNQPSDTQLLMEAVIADEWREDRRRAVREAWIHWPMMVSATALVIFAGGLWWVRTIMVLALLVYAATGVYYSFLWWRKANRYLEGWVGEIRDRSD